MNENKYTKWNNDLKTHKLQKEKFNINDIEKFKINVHKKEIWIT